MGLTLSPSNYLYSSCIYTQVNTVISFLDNSEYKILGYLLMRYTYKWKLQQLVGCSARQLAISLANLQYVYTDCVWRTHATYSYIHICF